MAFLSLGPVAYEAMTFTPSLPRISILSIRKQTLIDLKLLLNSRRVSGPTRRSSKANWTEEEDEILRDAVKKYEGKSWKKIAGCLPGRADVQCLHRWQKVLNPDLVKGPWSKEEDSLLVELVGKSGEKKWSEIAERLPGRMGKQCRERWNNHLKPEINKAAWTDEEEKILINAHAEYGNKWSILAKLLPGRTENSVKNHWNCSLKKRLCNSACGSAVNHPRLTIPPLQANNKGVTRDSTEENQTLSTTNLCKQKVDSGSNAESSSMNMFLEYSGSPLSYPPFSAKPNNPVRSQKSAEAEHNPNYGTTKTEVQGCSSLDENDLRHGTDKPPLVCSAPPETSLQYLPPFPDSPDKACSKRDLIRPRQLSDACDNLESSSEWSYTGLCYEPIQRQDLNIFLSTGRFPSTESYIRQPWPVSVPSSRWHMKEPSDPYSRTRSILRSAAMSYRNMPSIIRKRAIQLLHKGVSAPENVVSPSSRATGGHEVPNVDDNQVHTSIFLSQMSEGLKSLQPLNLWGFERDFRDA
ncbi:Homeodomain-like protein [Perilla frutescens var. hirtella]|nr:Homeodomain-like protein [Perilla frutescens var. hirtella]